jgi:tetratricopeptide (TPR) repeat protein
MGKRALSLSLAFSGLLFLILMTSEKAFADSADPNSDTAFLAKVNLARSYIITNQEPEAQALIDELFAVSDGDKTKAEAARILAEDYLYIWKKRKANRLFRYFVENDPNNPNAREALAQVACTYIAIEDYNAAEAAARQLVAKYPDHNDTPKFLHSTARSFRRKEQFEKALPLLDHLVAGYPDDPHCEKAWMEKATIGLDSANDIIVEQVISKFKEELRENPFVAEPFRMFADQFALRYEAQQARELYQYIIDNSRDSEEVLQCQMGQAMILVDSNDETAFDALIADLSSRPQAAKLLHDLAHKCEWFEHPAHAEAAYRGIIEVDPDYDAAAVTFRQIGWTLYARGLYDQAITECRKSLEMYPKSKWAPSCRYWIAQSYLKKRDFDQARMEYQKVVDKYPSDRYANYSRKKIAAIDRRSK